VGRVYPCEKDIYRKSRPFDLHMHLPIGELSDFDALTNKKFLKSMELPYSPEH